MTADVAEEHLDDVETQRFGAQLVAQHGEKFVLLLIRLDELALGFLLLPDVPVGGRHANDVAAGVADG